MKKRVMLLGLGLIGLILAGCVVPSIYPFYTEKDLVEEPALLGKWVSTDPAVEETWTFTKSGDKGYRTFFPTSETTTNEISIHLFKLDGQLFMDCLFLNRYKDDYTYFVPAHMLLKVLRIKPVLSTATLNDDFIGDLLKKDPTALRHLTEYVPPDQTNDSYPVLTADTAELQAFLRKNMGNTNLFNPPGTGMKKDVADAK